MGQRIDSNQGSAESNNSWSDVNLTNLPLSEVKPLYRLIFAGDSDYTNVPKCTLLSILDIRVSVISTIAGVSQNDHGSLFGLGDDDHSQYLHVDNNRTVNATHNFVNGLTSNGLINSTSGNFTNLTVNNTGVSLNGHTHSSSDITDFNSSVSGLLPTIANSGDNRILTSTGSTVGINAESNLTFDGTNLTAPYLVASNSSGDEGGEIQLAKPPNGTLSGGITIDAYQNRLRFFEQGGSARGFYLDLSSAGAGASTNLAVDRTIHSTTTAIDWLPRGHGTIGNAGATSGGLMLAFFTAPYSFTATTLTFITGGTATASLSLCRFALFTVDETIIDSVTGTSPIITMVARTANDTTIGNAIQTIYSRVFAATGGYPASYNIVAGTRYAAGALVVGGTVGTWQAGTVSTGAITRLPPMVAGLVTSLSDLPTSPTSVSNGSFVLYGRIS
jgi:hypothetical protein